MAWIEAHEEIVRHPKTLHLAQLLEEDFDYIEIPHIVGHLFCLWFWCLSFAQDGNLSKYDVKRIAAAAMWSGDPDLFFDAMRTAGFLDVSGDKKDIRVHDWIEYGGRLLMMRQSNAAKQKKFREDHANKNSPAKSHLRRA